MGNNCVKCGRVELDHPLKNLINVNTGKRWSCKQFIPNHSSIDEETSRLKGKPTFSENKDPDSGNDLRHNDSGSAFILSDKVTMGKKSRRDGMRFETKVRKDLEAKGWIVDKWTNNLQEQMSLNESGWDYELHPAKSFRGITRSNGFPDFIAFKWDERDIRRVHEVIGVEVKTNGILSKIEKEKCTWYLDNNIFSKILIASKGDKEIVYKEFSLKGSNAS